jgi:hypothetical protein
MFLRREVPDIVAVLVCIEHAVIAFVFIIK